MKVVWQPDAENVYLSSGSDNLALHQIAKKDVPSFRNATPQVLDHLGFIMESPSLVDRFFERVEKAGVKIVHPLKRHRDGSYSFYLADPDGNTVQVLYEPNLSNVKD
jgi:catechol 2,3-dioxygenase-like lactoylglutathione lyase family enzyme